MSEDIGYILGFLSRLRDNNNREWFAAHRDEYDRYRVSLDALAERLIAVVAGADSRAAWFAPKDVTYRIYRDARFSHDKTPYKTHAGIFVNPPYGKKSETAGYYFHFEPGNVAFYAGAWCLPPKPLAALREAIRDNVEEYLSIVKAPEFAELFPTVGEDWLKTAPKGFDRNWEYIDLVRPKMFTVGRKFEDEQWRGGDFFERLNDCVQQAAGFVRFQNEVITEVLKEMR